jgi:hypothetical protein
LLSLPSCRFVTIEPEAPASTESKRSFGVLVAKRELRNDKKGNRKRIAQNLTPINL